MSRQPISEEARVVRFFQDASLDRALCILEVVKDIVKRRTPDKLHRKALRIAEKVIQAHSDKGGSADETPR